MLKEEGSDRMKKSKKQNNDPSKIFKLKAQEPVNT